MKKIPQLDAIRGIAVLLVLLHNTDRYPSLHLHLISDNGWMGVDLFFVLSGLLITGILLDTKQFEGYFRNFYARRCLRIWPLYYSVLLFMFVIVPILRPSEAHTVFEARSSPWWAFPLFLQNFLVRIPTSATGALGVTWSLAVEEQFYLIWPLVVRFCNEAQLRKITIAVICISPALRFYLLQHQVNIYSNTFCRLDGLMAGALLAMIIRSVSFSPSTLLTRAWIALLVSAPLALVLEMTFHARWIVFSLTALASASFIYLALFSAQKWLHSLLTNRFLVYTGTISYGIYLLQKIPLDAAKTFHLDQHQFLALPMTAAATYGMAVVSWNLLEKPALRLKRFFEPRTIHTGTADGGLLSLAER
ncbi:MAG TPA: acyltransferase [Terriglobales bacterium]|jgi:peptidoglycan/LPS O-acetylase OafA/YrhL|nr:acyltransferase [Terriglobales bacterium]